MFNILRKKKRRTKRKKTTTKKPQEKHKLKVSARSNKEQQGDIRASRGRTGGSAGRSDGETAQTEPALFIFPELWVSQRALLCLDTAVEVEVTWPGGAMTLHQ